MKKNFLKYFILCLTAVTALVFSSCSSDDSYDFVGNPNNLVYLSINSKNTLNSAVVHTPVGEFGGLDFKIPAFIQRAVTKATTVSLVADNSLIDAFNQKNSTDYVALPDGFLNLSEAVAHIKADTVATYDSLRITFKDGADLSQLTAKGYVAPLRLKVEGDGTASEERGIVYVIITTSTSLINDSPTGLLGTKADGSNWKCLSADGLDANDFATENWSFTKKQATSSFVVDLGATHKVSGYLVGSNLINNGEIAVSEDNSTWTTLGSLRGHKGIDEEIDWSTYTWYVLYGAVPARYVKVTMNLNTSYWGWNYMQWGYCTIDKFGLTYND
jgi:hypothetical protein